MPNRSQWWRDRVPPDYASIGVGFQDAAFYDVLDELRRLRNRIHIQNTKNDFEADEYNAFTIARKTKAEQALEKTMKTLAANHPRPVHTQGYVPDFSLPWAGHY